MKKIEKQEFKKLQKENDKIRDKLRDFISLAKFQDDFWDLINKLIENEIEQEKFCNQ